MLLLQGLFLFLVVWAGFSIVFYTLRTGISPMPSSRGAKHSVLSLIPPESEGEILEMGSGWGTLAIPLAKRCPKAKVLAYELSPIPWLYSNLLKRLYGLENLEFHRKDFQKVDLKRASLVVSYLFPEGMEKLRRKFEKELPKNTMVITHTFRVPGWTPKEEITLPDIYRTKVYLYSAGSET
ncbi:MAG: SAM-dependent methyltransferase [Myxococcota bacterium]|nr:SAM-dependent methyltransferase [Myxococcota bacterium]